MARKKERKEERKKQFHYFRSLRRIFLYEGKVEDETGITIEFLEKQGKPKAQGTFGEGSTDTPYSSSFKPGLPKVVEKIAAFYYSGKIDHPFLFLSQLIFHSFLSSHYSFPNFINRFAPTRVY